MNAFVLSQTDLLILPLIAVVMFFALFVAALAWVLRPGAQRVYAERSQLALDDGIEIGFVGKEEKR